MKISILKPIGSLFFLIMLTVSCTSTENDRMEDEVMGQLEMSMISFKGDFQSSAHPTIGIASINIDQTELNFTNFKTDDGPDLNIYLVSDINSINTDYKDLGDIKGVEGNFRYTLPSNIDYQTYKYVVIWCVDFDVNFGYAILAP